MDIMDDLSKIFASNGKIPVDMDSFNQELMEHLEELLALKFQTDQIGKHFYEIKGKIDSFDSLDYLIIKTIIQEGAVNNEDSLKLNISLGELTNTIFNKPGYFETNIIFERILSYNNIALSFFVLEDGRVYYNSNPFMTDLNELRKKYDEVKIESLMCTFVLNFKWTFLDDDVMLDIIFGKKAIDNLMKLN